MPRNMSFALTTEQFLNRTKTVTRRLGWATLKRGDIVMGCKKCMGLKKGEKIERLGAIRIVNVRQETLKEITDEEAVREGFPEMNRTDFINFFLSEIQPHNGLNTEVTRIEFEYI